MEQILPIDVQGIVGRFFSQRECEALMKQPAEERLSCFYRLWTLKESYLKAMQVWQAYHDASMGFLHPLRASVGKACTG